MCVERVVSQDPTSGPVQRPVRLSVHSRLRRWRSREGRNRGPCATLYVRCDVLRGGVLRRRDGKAREEPLVGVVVASMKGGHRRNGAGVRARAPVPGQACGRLAWIADNIQPGELTDVYVQGKETFWVRSCRGWTATLLRHATYGSVYTDCGERERLYWTAVNRAVRMCCTKHGRYPRTICADVWQAEPDVDKMRPVTGVGSVQDTSRVLPVFGDMSR